MGYLSQKKHENRKNIFLYLMTVLMIILTAYAFLNTGFHFGFFNLFHLYCLSVILLVYALASQRYKEAGLFALVLVINYTSLAAHTNIFLSTRFDGDKQLSLAFKPEDNFVSDFNKDDIKSAGNLVLAGRHSASFVVLDKENPLTIIRVDLQKAKKKEYALIFSHLRKFILKQDNPVIIFGNFGIPAWNYHFKRFLNLSDLTVKNRLMFLNGNHLKPSDFYILGFREMGIANMQVTTNKNISAVDIDISFNPAQI